MTIKEIVKWHVVMLVVRPVLLAVAIALASLAGVHLTAADIRHVVDLLLQDVEVEYVGKR